VAVRPVAERRPSRSGGRGIIYSVEVF